MQKRNLEQRCAIKLYVKLNENATETYDKLKRAYGGTFLGNVKHFWITVNVWKTNLVLEGFAHQKRKKM